MNVSIEQHRNTDFDAYFHGKWTLIETDMAEYRMFKAIIIIYGVLLFPVHFKNETNKKKTNEKNQSSLQSKSLLLKRENQQKYAA